MKNKIYIIIAVVIILAIAIIYFVSTGLGENTENNNGEQTQESRKNDRTTREIESTIDILERTIEILDSEKDFEDLDDIED
jgi:flagellar basal body-associated protein FliL